MYNAKTLRRFVSENRVASRDAIYNCQNICYSSYRSIKYWKVSNNLYRSNINIQFYHTMSVCGTMTDWKAKLFFWTKIVQYFDTKNLIQRRKYDKRTWGTCGKKGKHFTDTRMVLAVKNKFFSLRSSTSHRKTKLGHCSGHFSTLARKSQSQSVGSFTRTGTLLRYRVIENNSNINKQVE